LDQLAFKKLLIEEIDRMCKIALIEDLAGENNNDITAELISPSVNAIATLITREAGILCGSDWLNKIFQLAGSNMEVEWHCKDGDTLTPGQTICELKGNARELLTGERSAMNFLQSLSATATLTHQYIQQMNNPNCKLLDTRKTIPGMRFGQKYAVSCGGGTNHRIGLSDAYLIKENHIMACGGIEKALAKAIEMNPNKLLEIEVESIDELHQAIKGKAQVIMLDNFSLDDMHEARAIINQVAPLIKLEASGNVNFSTISDIAATGVDYISVGALTKDIKALDLSLRVKLVQES
jgi:nicotinate-nucleotide pyrophosphorylase (carboxylating)